MFVFTYSHINNNVPENASSGRESTFGRSLMNYVNSYLPYQSYTVIDTISKLNPKFKTFQDTGSRRTEALTRQSVSSSSEYNNISPMVVIPLHGKNATLRNQVVDYPSATIEGEQMVIDNVMPGQHTFRLDF